MTRRLYLAPASHSLQATSEITLNREQSHYLRSVLRLRSGSDLELFNGIGQVARATLLALDRRSASLAVNELVTVPPPERRLVCAPAVLKNQAMDRVIQKATELGATDLAPLYTEHTQIPNSARNSETRQQHWQRIAESTAEQCGQNYLPKLNEPVALADFLADLPAEQGILLALGGGPFPTNLKAKDTLVLSGPEGGWSQAEIDQMRERGLQTVQIGSLVLRAETAPLAGLVSVQLAWEQAERGSRE